jgi:signal transduction histidine kinase
VGSGFGLVSVRERLGFVHGKLLIESIPGDGTVATMTVPLMTQSSAATASVKVSK